MFRRDAEAGKLFIFRGGGRETHHERCTVWMDFWLRRCSQAKCVFFDILIKKKKKRGRKEVRTHLAGYTVARSAFRLELATCG